MSGEELMVNGPFWVLSFGIWILGFDLNYYDN